MAFTVIDFTDHSCGWCSLLPNILRGYGWNPGLAAEDFFGNLLDKKLNMGPDITFKQVCGTNTVSPVCHISSSLRRHLRLTCQPATRLTGLAKLG